MCGPAAALVSLGPSLCIVFVAFRRQLTREEEDVDWQTQSMARSSSIPCGTRIAMIKLLRQLSAEYASRYASMFTIARERLAEDHGICVICLDALCTAPVGCLL